MLVAFDIVAIVRAFMKTNRTFDHVGGPYPCLASGEIREQYLLRFALLAGETKIPLPGGKTVHPKI